MAAQTSIETIFFTEDEFDCHFDLEMLNGSTTMTEADVAHASPAHIWTLMDVDGSLYLVNGFYSVDAVGYSISEQPVAYGVHYEVKLDD